MVKVLLVKTAATVYTAVRALLALSLSCTALLLLLFLLLLLSLPIIELSFLCQRKQLCG